MVVWFKARDQRLRPRRSSRVKRTKELVTVRRKRWISLDVEGPRYWDCLSVAGKVGVEEECLRWEDAASPTVQRSEGRENTLGRSWM